MPRIKAFARKDWSGCPECGSPTKHKKDCPRAPNTPEGTPICHWCGEKLKFDKDKGWVHQDGSIYKQRPDGKDDHCVLPEWPEIWSVR